MKCCQVECETPFCPHCGKAVDAHGLTTLLQHCRVQADQLDRKLSIRKRRHKETDEQNGVTPRADSQYERCERTILKWQRWTEALEEAIASKQTK